MLNERGSRDGNGVAILELQLNHAGEKSMSPKRKKNLHHRKETRAKRPVSRWQLLGAGFLCFMIGADGYALFNVIQHLRTYGDLLLESDMTTFLGILTVSAILNLLLISLDRQAPR